MVAIPRLIPPRALAPKASRPASAGANDHWSDLMVSAQGGHGGAYQRLLTEIDEWLRRYFERRLPSAEVDDAVQETLMAVHRRRHTYDSKYPLGVWLTAIAKHKWIDQLRVMSRRPTDELSDDVPVGDHEARVMSASVLADVLEHLRPAQARVITLVKLEGYTLAEASHQTGQSLSAVKMNIHRGLARLTTLLENDDDVE